MASDQEILEVFIKIANPQIFEKLDQLKNQHYTINISGNLDKGLQDILAIRGKNIEITANTQSALNSLKGIQESLKSIQDVASIQIKIDPKNVNATLAQIDEKISALELKAKNINPAGASAGRRQNILDAPELTQALKSFSSGTQIGVQEVEQQIAAARKRNIQSLLGQVLTLESNQRQGGAATPVPLTEVRSYIKSQQNQAFEQQLAIAQAESQRQAEATFRSKLEASIKAKGGPPSIIGGGIDELQAERLRRLARQQEIEETARLAADTARRERQAEEEARRTAEINRFRSIAGAAPQGPFSPINKGKQDRAAFGQLGESIALGALQGQGPVPLAGSVLGGLAGAAFGPVGASIGSQVGGAVGQFSVGAFEKLAEALKKAADAGIQFESSLLGISSILQATTTVTGPNGEAVSASRQLEFQGTQARGIQQAARAKLLPLGIAGEKEATLVQAVIAGASQRGIQLTPEQAAQVAERLGGAIQAQRPELLQNTSQIRRDVEDLLGGLPNRTILSSLVKGFAPGIGEATSAEDLIKRTQGLSSFPDSLKNSDNPLVAINQLNATLDNLNTTIGDKIINTLAPAFKEVNKVLSDPAFVQALESLTADIAGFVSFIIQAAANITKEITTNPAIKGGAAGAALGNTFFGLPGAILGGAIGAAAGPNQSPPDADPETIGSTAASLIQKDQLTSTPSASARIRQILRGTGIEDFSLGADDLDATGKLESLSLARGLINKSSDEAIALAVANFKEAQKKDPAAAREALESSLSSIRSRRIDERLGANQAIGTNLQSLVPERSALFDVSSQLGQINQQEAVLPIQQELTKNAEERVKLAKERANNLLKSIGPGTSEDAAAETRIKAATEVRQAEENLTKARLAEADAIDKLKQTEIERSRVLRESQIDQGTFRGRIQAAQSNIQTSDDQKKDAQRRIDELTKALENTTDPIDKGNISSRLERAKVDFNQAEVAGTSARRDRQNRTLDLEEGIFKASEVIRQFTQSAAAAADKVGELADRSARSEIQLAQLALTSENLNQSLTTASRAASDFQEDTNLRKLGAQNATRSAAQSVFDAATGAGFDPSEALGFLGGNVNSAFIKGSPDYDPQAAGLSNIQEAQERLRVAQRSESRLSITDQEEFARQEREVASIALQQQGIPLDKRDIARNQREIDRATEALPFERKEREFTALRSAIGLSQGLGDAAPPELQKFIEDRGKDLGIKGEALQKVKDAQTIDAQVPQNVADIAQTTKDILAVLSGGKPSAEQTQKLQSEGALNVPLETVPAPNLGIQYSNPDAPYIEALEPMGALSPSLETVAGPTPKVLPAGYNTSARAELNQGLDDIFKSVPGTQNQAEVLAKAIGDSQGIYQPLSARRGANALLKGPRDKTGQGVASGFGDSLGDIKNVRPTVPAGLSGSAAASTAAGGNSEVKAPDVVQAIKDGFSSMEASFRKALESSI